MVAVEHIAQRLHVGHRARRPQCEVDLIGLRDRAVIVAVIDQHAGAGAGPGGAVLVSIIRGVVPSVGRRQLRDVDAVAREVEQDRPAVAGIRNKVGTFAVANRPDVDDTGHPPDDRKIVEVDGIAEQPDRGQPHCREHLLDRRQHTKNSGIHGAVIDLQSRLLGRRDITADVVSSLHWRTERRRQRWRNQVLRGAGRNASRGARRPVEHLNLTEPKRSPAHWH